MCARAARLIAISDAASTYTSSRDAYSREVNVARRWKLLAHEGNGECHPLYTITADNRSFVEPRVGAAPAPAEVGCQTIA